MHDHLPPHLVSARYTSFENAIKTASILELKLMVDMMGTYSKRCYTGQATLDERRNRRWRNNTRTSRGYYIDLVRFACWTNVQCWVLVVKEWLTPRLLVDEEDATPQHHGKASNSNSRAIPLSNLSDRMQTRWKGKRRETSRPPPRIRTHWDCETDAWTDTMLSAADFMLQVRSWPSSAVCLHHISPAGEACQEDQCVRGLIFREKFAQRPVKPSGLFTVSRNKAQESINYDDDDIRMEVERRAQEKKEIESREVELAETKMNTQERKKTKKKIDDKEPELMEHTKNLLRLQEEERAAKNREKRMPEPGSRQVRQSTAFLEVMSREVDSATGFLPTAAALALSKRCAPASLSGPVSKRACVSRARPSTSGNPTGSETRHMTKEKNRKEDPPTEVQRHTKESKRESKKQEAAHGALSVNGGRSRQPDKFVTPPPMRSPSPPAELSASPTPDGGIRPFSDIALLPSPTPQADVDFEFFESLLKAPNKIQTNLSRQTTPTPALCPRPKSRGHLASGSKTKTEVIDLVTDDDDSGTEIAVSGSPKRKRGVKKAPSISVACERSLPARAQTAPPPKKRGSIKRARSVRRWDALSFVDNYEPTDNDSQWCNDNQSVFVPVDSVYDPEEYQHLKWRSEIEIAPLSEVSPQPSMSEDPAESDMEADREKDTYSEYDETDNEDVEVSQAKHGQSSNASLSSSLQVVVSQVHNSNIRSHTPSENEGDSSNATSSDQSDDDDEDMDSATTPPSSAQSESEAESKSDEESTMPTPTRNANQKPKKPVVLVSRPDLKRSHGKGPATQTMSPPRSSLTRSQPPAILPPTRSLATTTRRPAVVPVTKHNSRETRIVPPPSRFHQNLAAEVSSIVPPAKLSSSKPPTKTKSKVPLVEEEIEDAGNFDIVARDSSQDDESSLMTEIQDTMGISGLAKCNLCFRKGFDCDGLRSCSSCLEHSRTCIDVTAKSLERLLKRSITISKTAEPLISLADVPMKTCGKTTSATKVPFNAASSEASSSKNSRSKSAKTPTPSSKTPAVEASTSKTPASQAPASKPSSSRTPNPKASASKTPGSKTWPVEEPTTWDPEPVLAAYRQNPAQFSLLAMKLCQMEFENLVAKADI